MSIFKLKAPFRPSGGQPQAIKSLVKGLKNGCDYQTLLGITGSGKTFVMASVIGHFDMPVLVIAPNKTLAAQLYREYKNFFPQNSVNYFVSYYDYYQPEAYLPITDTYIEKEAMINEEIDRLRHRATSALLTRRDVIIVASVSCIYNLGLPLNYLASSLRLEIGQPITRGDLIRQLIKVQFVRASEVLKRGFFRVRGDVFEIMPASENIVYRIKLNEQKVKEIILLPERSPKTTSGLSRGHISELRQNLPIRQAQGINFGKLKQIVIFPPKHFISGKPQIKQAVKEIKKELKERLEHFRNKGFDLEAERLRRRTNYDMEMLQSIGYCHGVENYSRHLTGKLAGQPPDTLLAYFPRRENNRPDFLTIVDESHISVPQLEGMYSGDKSRKETLVQFGWRLPSALDNRPLKFSEFKERLGPAIFTSATPGTYELKNSGQVVELVIRPTGLVDPAVEVRPVFDKAKNQSQVDDLIKEIRRVAGEGERAIVNTLTKKMAEDLDNFLAKKNFRVNYIHSDVPTLKRAEILTDFRAGKFDILIGVNLLREGLDLPEVTLVAILDADREGFLRNETSLIQTMGRAARNVKGKVILYANNMTGSMKRAINEVGRRRQKQLAYNKKHGIRPQSIQKRVEQLI